LPWTHKWTEYNFFLSWIFESDLGFLSLIEVNSKWIKWTSFERLSKLDKKTLSNVAVILMVIQH